MLPWILAAAAQILASKQQQEQARRDAMQKQLNTSAQRMGGGDYLQLGGAYDDARHIGQMSADYSPILSIVGRAFDTGTDDSGDNDGAGKGFEWTNDPFNPRKRK